MMSQRPTVVWTEVISANPLRAATVRARIDRLERAGEIIGYTVVLRADAQPAAVRALARALEPVDPRPHGGARDLQQHRQFRDRPPAIVLGPSNDLDGTKGMRHSEHGKPVDFPGRSRILARDLARALEPVDPRPHGGARDLQQHRQFRDRPPAIARGAGPAT
jgi:hypothetical protein